VDRIFGQAGVKTRWIDGDPQPGESFYSLVIPSKDFMPDQRLRGQGGFAIPEARRAYVWANEDPALLGHSTADEAGHLLLGPGHTGNGMMQAGIGNYENREKMAQGRLLFEDSQSELIRKALEVRDRERTQG